jgi:hypothetical protein
MRGGHWAMHMIKRVFLFPRLAEIGGRELAGEAKELDTSLFYDPMTGE